MRCRLMAFAVIFLSGCATVGDGGHGEKCRIAPIDENDAVRVINAARKVEHISLDDHFIKEIKYLQCGYMISIKHKNRQVIHPHFTYFFDEDLNYIYAINF